MTRVIHTGDTHLGYQQYHVPERRQDFLAAFRQVAADAVADDVDAVVHAGDLFHDRRPTLPDIMGALDVLETLADADVPFLAVVGNHEAKRDAQWLDLYESLGLATRLGDAPVTVGDTAFYGLDFVPRANRDDLDLDLEAHDAEHAALVTHGLFEPFDLGDWDVSELLESADVAVDAVLLGDNHDPGTKRVEEPYEAWVTYCGSTERASADERADRGYNVVTFDDGVDVRRRGLETREFVFVDVDLGPGEGVERVRERVAQHDLADVVVHVSVDGDGEPIAPATVEEFAHDQGALVARVTDRREFADEAEVDVSFADPDEAVRERVRDLGLSRAAREIDEAVRESKLADSNVDDAVEERVRDLVDDGDLDAFQRAPADTDADADSGQADRDATPEAASDAEATDAAGETPASPDDESAGAADVDGGAAGAHGETVDLDRDTADADQSAGDGADDPEDQSTMEEYL